MSLSRRTFVAGALALSGAPLARAAEPLRSLAARQGIEFGCAISSRHLGEADLMELVSRECAGIVPEGEGKWASLRPSQDIFNFAPLDAIAGLARGRGLALRGHTLLWQHSLPDWLARILSDTPERAEEVLIHHVDRVVRRYGGFIRCWDVVNEVLGDGGLRPGPWVDALGLEAVTIAFAASRAASPNTRLILNETAIESAAGPHAQRRHALLKLMETLLSRGVPMDGLGIQAHLRCSEPIDQGELRRFLSDVGGLGLDILITELDVNDAEVSGDPERRDRVVADHASRFLDVVLDELAVKSVYCWGLSDRHSWLHHHPAGWRADGARTRPLPFDAGLVAKPLAGALARAFAGARWRP
ncbi:endo-1,4-beta-xylanase [Magnetospirillum sp. SS-4]|uniref:endo-1,4-beta-xylanase n=1 Tax=Magnetospirillum sp. SS-4 TaxID=2681465 RepID=UPI00138631F7|nr:endo-1,4-beta-xylanase [Magnetospirillum sp. SS-4]CAA7621923.1 Glycosyl hydrolase family 10 [Magnetospirillum sp. SS-4]